MSNIALKLPGLVVPAEEYVRDTACPMFIVSSNVILNFFSSEVHLLSVTY